GSSRACSPYLSFFLHYHPFFKKISAGNEPGLCRYGRRVDCCYGWKMNSKGQCEAQCEHGCKHGECVGPNKCKCSPGYTGKTCSQDLNECGLKPRPCEHRCMNTHGSYKCYCLNGYMLMPDGSCASRTCALAHCQYGCEEVQGETQCLCPSAGLQLGPDQRTCVDIDECESRRDLCPYNKRCVNTFGSYFCKCQLGFELKYVNGKYDCADVDECTGSSHKCSKNAMCLNTQGSYKCKCKPGFRGSGVDCTGETPRQIGNVIPESHVTMPTKVRLQPFDYDGGIYVGNPKETEAQDNLPVEEEEEEDEEEDEEEGDEEEDEEEDEDEGAQENQENQIKSMESSPRGDVFFPQSVFGTQTEVKEIPVLPGQEEFIVDCGFDQGSCEWIQDKGDDFDWTVIYHEKGPGYYLAANDFLGNRNGLARLKLLLGEQAQRGTFCLTFTYRVMGEQTGILRVLLDKSSYPMWEQGHSGQDWQTEVLTVPWEKEAPQLIIFEAERSKGVRGEIGLDNVVLTSGSCQDHDSVIF
uniref:EGF-like-domain, multiple 6 n=1 Tax=Scleropages formosus TaxID=113540 RepID=A0A8C9QXS3_SCLFO